MFYFVFTYGSNLDIKQMKNRCPGSKYIGIGCLKGYKLYFTRYSYCWGGGVADIIKDDNYEVWGLIYKITKKDLDILDDYECCPNAYKRYKTTINTSKDILNNVWIYEVVEKNDFINPTKEYLEIIKNAAREFNFPKIYIDYLNTIETK